MTVVTSGQAATPAADPVSMISALLDAEKVIPNKTPQTPDGKAQPPGDAEYQPGKNANVEGEDAPGDIGEETPEKAAVAEIPLDQLEAIELEVEVSGDKGKVVEKLPIKELKLGYMRQKDYQTKTAEVARQREEVGEKVRQGIQSERTQYANTLQQLQTALIETVAPEFKNVDWNDLAQNNQYEYIRLVNRRDQIINALNNVKQKQQEVQVRQQADGHRAAQAQAQKTWTTLEADIPGWNADIYDSALKASESLGYTKAETGAWLDARAIKLLHKAYLYDQLKAGTPADKKVVVAPKVIAPGAVSTVSKPAQRQAKALDRLRNTGKLDDLADVIASMG